MSVFSETPPAPPPELFSRGHALDPKEFGYLIPSLAEEEAEAQRGRMESQGYLYLRGFLPREEVRAARLALAQRLRDEGHLDKAFPLEACRARPGLSLSFRPDIAKDCAPLNQLLYGDRMMGFFRRFLGGEALHYTYTWLRTVAPGKGSQPHCDIVYMGRGTPRVYTVWTPLGDIPVRSGGLLILEGSHRNEGLRGGYGRMDVDEYCENREGHPSAMPLKSGALCDDPYALRQDLGGRWLTAPEFRMGDVVIFGMYLAHGSLDNRGEDVRISSDSRYQLAAEPADERWIGENPIGQAPSVKRGRIC